MNVQFFCFESDERVVFPVSFSRSRKFCFSFSLSEAAVKSLTLAVDGGFYKVKQSTLAAMCKTPVAAEAVVVEFRLPRSATSVAVTFKCKSKFGLSVSENFEPLMNSAESLRECLSNCLDDVKSALKQHKWEPVPSMPFFPDDKADECKDKIVFNKEKEKIDLLSREVEKKSLEFFANVSKTFKTCADCDSSTPPLPSVSYCEFKKCRDGLRIVSLRSILTTIEDGNNVINALNCLAPKGRFLFPDEKFPPKAVTAKSAIISAAKAVQCFFMYEFHRGHSKQLSLLLLCCLTANSSKEYEECQALLRSAVDDLEESKALSSTALTGSLQSLQNMFTSLRENLLNLSRLFCDWKRKNAWISQTFFSPRVELDLLSFDNKNALLQGAVPSLHLLDSKDSVLVPSIKSFVIKMRCSNASPESMLVRFCIWNDSISVRANYTIESVEDAAEFSKGFDMVSSSGTINPLSKVEIAVAFSDSVSAKSFRRRALRRSYTLKIWSSLDDFQTLARPVEFFVEGTLESVNDCILVSCKTIDFGVIDVREKSSDIERLLTLTNTASTDVKFQMISAQSNKYEPSIVVRCGKHARACHKVEHVLPSGSTFDITFVLKLGSNSQPKRFRKQYTIRFSSEKEISVCAKVQLIQPFVVGYVDDTSSKLEDSEIIQVSNTASEKILTFYNPFSVSSPLLLNLGAIRKHFYLEPSRSHFLVLPKTSQRISVRYKGKESSSLLNVEDGHRAKQYSVIPDCLLAETHSVYDCDVKFNSARSDSLPIPKVDLELWLKSRFEEEVEVWSDTLEVSEHEKVKLKSSKKGTIMFHWRAGSFLQTKGSFICRRLKSGQDISVPIRINFRSQITNVDMRFIDQPKVACAVVDADGGNINASFRVKTGCKLTADGVFFAVGAESFEISKTRVKDGRYFWFSVNEEEERQIRCRPKSDADWYGFSIKISLRGKFAGNNGKAFPLWRRIYLVGKAFNIELRKPLGRNQPSSDVDAVRHYLAEAASEDSSAGIIRHLTDAFFRLADNSSGNFGSATTLQQFLKVVEIFDQNSTAKAIILSLLKYSQSFEKAEFGVLLAMKEERGNASSMKWLAEALIFPKTQTLSSSSWILTSSINVLDSMASSIVAEESVKESLQHFILLLKRFDDICHRLPPEASKKASLLAISELIVKNSKKEDFLGVLWAKYYGRNCQNATDCLNWISGFNSLGAASSKRICSVELLKSSVQLACCSLKACDIAFYIADAVDFSCSQMEGAWLSPARLVLQRLGGALDQNPLAFLSMESLFQLFCNVISCWHLSAEYKEKIKCVLMLFPVAWKSIDMKGMYASLGKIIAAFSNGASPCNKATEKFSKFLLDLKKDDAKQCIVSYSDLLVSWFNLRDRSGFATVIHKVTRQAIYHSAYVADWKRFFVNCHSVNVVSASAKCSKLSKVFQTSRPLFTSMKILNDIGELLLNEESKDYTAFCKSIEELMKENVGLQPCVAAFETFAALVGDSDGEQFQSGIKAIASKITLLDRALSFESSSETLCSIRQVISFETFQLASSVLYCQSFGSEDDKTSFQSIKGLLNRGLLSDKLSQVMKATLFDLPTALMGVALLFCPDDLDDACKPYVERAKQILERKLNLERLLAKIVISANKGIDAQFKEFLVENLDNFVRAFNTKTVSEVLCISCPVSKQWDEMAINEALLEVDWYGSTASAFLTFISKSSAFDENLTECLTTSKNVAHKLQKISSIAASLLPQQRAFNFSSFISDFVSNLVIITEPDNIYFKAVAYIFDNMPSSPNKANCEAQSFDLAFSITEKLLFNGNLTVPKKQGDFARLVLSYFQDAPSFELASLIDALCSGDISCAEKDVLVSLRSIFSITTAGSNERSWEHVVGFLRNFASMNTVTKPVSNAILSVVKLCSAVFREESNSPQRHLVVFDCVIECATAMKCKLEYHNLLFDIKEYFSLLCQTHWQLPICQKMQEVVERLFERNNLEIEESLEAVTDLADCLGLIEKRSHQDDHNVLFKKFYSLSQSLECGSNEVISLCGHVVSLAVNVEATLAIVPSDVTLLLEILHGCWKLSKDEKSFAENWESYVAYSIGAILTWLNSPTSSRKALRALSAKDESESSLAKGVVRSQFNPKWSILKDEEFCLNLAVNSKITYGRCLSTESEGSSKFSSNSVEDLSVGGSSDEGDSDDHTERSFLAIMEKFNSTEINTVSMDALSIFDALPSIEEYQELCAEKNVSNIRKCIEQGGVVKSVTIRLSCVFYTSCYLLHKGIGSATSDDLLKQMCKSAVALWRCCQVLRRYLCDKIYNPMISLIRSRLCQTEKEDSAVQLPLEYICPAANDTLASAEIKLIRLLRAFAQINSAETASRFLSSLDISYNDSDELSEIEELRPDLLELFLSEARKSDSYAHLENEFGSSSAILHHPPEFVLDDDDDDSLSGSSSGVYSKSKKRETDLHPNLRRLGDRIPIFAKRKPTAFQTSVGEEMKRVARKTVSGIVSPSYAAVSSSSLKESSEKGSTTLKQRAKVSASKLSSEYVQKLLKETSLKDQMEMQGANSKGLSEGNQGRGVLEKFYELKTRQEEVRMTYTGLSDILAEMKSAFLYHLRRAQLNLAEDDDKRSINTEMEFIFCLDNSGSMGGEKCQNALTALVLAMEALNKLESRFAVMRFGGEKTQQFFEPFDEEKGEFILEAMDNKEKTRPADAINWVINSPDGFRQSTDHSKLRTIILLTDGISEQMDRKMYREIFANAKFDIQLIIVNFRTVSLADDLHLDTGADSRQQRKVDTACEQISSFCVHVNPNDLSAVAPKLAEMIMKVMTEHLSNRRSALEAKGSEKVDFISQGILSDFTIEKAEKFLTKAVKDLELEKDGKRLVLLRELHTFRRILPDTSDINASDDLSENKEFKQELELPTVWKEKTATISAIIDEFTNVFRELLYPKNKFTKWQASLSGSSLHVPSLLKLIQTNYTYKRIFRKRTGGGSAKYDVCFLLDVSNSVQGSCLRSSTLAIIAMASALDNCDIESFSILSYSGKVTVIKSFSEKWGDVCVLRLLAAASSTLPESLDADGIHIAVDFFLANESSNPKQLFVFTDGFGSSGDRLQHEIKRATLAGVDVVGVGLGLEQTAVDKSYYSYVTAATVSHLPEALKGLCSSQPSATETPDWYKRELTAMTSISSKVKEEWKTHKDRKVYEGLADHISDKLSVAHHVYLENTTGFSASMNLDVCYVIDGTGSMSSYIQEAKTWIVEITKDICKNLEECGRQGNVKVACVIYRSSCCSTSYSNSPDIFDFDFAENISQRIYSVKCSGGCGPAADVMGGIDWALNLGGWRSNAVQYLIEMGDECPHGAYWNKSPSKNDVSAAKIEKDKSLIRSIHDRKMKFIFSTVVPGVRDRLRKGFKEIYNSPTKGLVLQELDFCGSSTGVQILSPGEEFKKIILKSILSEIL